MMAISAPPFDNWEIRPNHLDKCFTIVPSRSEQIPLEALEVIYTVVSENYQFISTHETPFATLSQTERMMRLKEMASVHCEDLKKEQVKEHDLLRRIKHTVNQMRTLNIINSNKRS